MASGLTLVGGFAVLMLSPMPLLRDFGVVVALAALFALFTTLTLLPPLLVAADQRGWLGLAERPAAGATTIREARGALPRRSGLLRRTRRGPSLPA